MAATVTNLYNNFAIGSATQATSSLSLTGGRLVLVTAEARHTSNTLTASCADTAGNVWGDFGLVVSVQAGDGTYAYQKTFYAIANASGGSTITVTWSAGPSQYSQLLVDEVSGVTWTAPIGDVHGEGSGGAVTANITTTGTLTDSAQANELLYVAVHANNSGSFVLAGYTSVVNDTTSFTAFKEVTAIQPAGTAVVVTVTTPQTAVPYTLQLMLFKEPTGGGAPPDTNTIFRVLAM